MDDNVRGDTTNCQSDDDLSNEVSDETDGEIRDVRPGSQESPEIGADHRGGENAITENTENTNNTESANS